MAKFVVEAIRSTYVPYLVEAESFEEAERIVGEHWEIHPEKHEEDFRLVSAYDDGVTEEICDVVPAEGDVDGEVISVSGDNVKLLDPMWREHLR